MRVRPFTQDDAHLFCTDDQIEDEVIGRDGLRHLAVRALRHGLRASSCRRGPSSGVGDDGLWDRAEHALQTALEQRGVPFAVNEGDGAFYGPKIDVHLTDALGRTWQCGTFQLDFNLPERFDLTYTGADDHDHRPVMIHRAMLGSFERFIGILIEHYAGEFPMWLAPTQAIVLPIADRHLAYARAMAAALAGRPACAPSRRAAPSRSARRSPRPRTRKIPAMLVVGDREAEQGTVSVRRHGRRDLGSQPLAELTGALLEEVAFKAPPAGPDHARRCAARSAPCATFSGGKQACVTQPSPFALHCGGRFQPKMRVSGRSRGPDGIADGVTYALYAAIAANEERRGAHLKTEHLP